MSEQKGVLERLLTVFSEVKKGEGRIVLLLALDIFALMVGYYLLKTLREPLILSSAAGDLETLKASGLPDWLKKGLALERGPQRRAVAAGVQAIVLMGFVPLFAWISQRVDRVRLLFGVTAFFIANLLLFFGAMKLGLPFVGFSFFVWVGIFSVSMIALFWSFANDLYSEEAGKRLFPIIGIGMSAGSPVGTLIAERLFAAQTSPEILLLLTISALAGYLVLSFFIHQKEPRTQAERVAEGGAGGGFMLVLNSPYLRLIAVVILLLNLVNTSGEYILSEAAVASAKAAVAADPSVEFGAAIGQFYSRFYFIVNIVSLSLQAFIVSRLVRFTGMWGVVFALPVIAIGVYSLVAAGALAYVLYLKIAENSTDYSIMNTAKAMLWLPTSKRDKYVGKQAVDTFFVRLGDLGSAIVVIFGTVWLQFGVEYIAAANAFFVAIWLGMSWLLVREYKKLQAQGASAK